MHKRWSIFPAILALCFNTALLSALPNPKDLRSRHANINDAGTPTSGPSSILTRRDYFHLGDGWTVHWNSLDFFFPNYPAAAQSLIDLYDSIIDKIAADWSFEPDQPARRVKYGDITFDIQSNQAISLGWLTQFCLNAIEQVRATYNAGSTAASYKLVFSRAISGVIIVVTLTLPLNGLAAAAA